MRYLRLRLRFSIVLGLTILTFFFLLTLHSLIWSTIELERPNQYPDRPKPPDTLPFWSALDHPNIYELKSTSSKKKQSRSPSITTARIDELFQLVRQAHDEQINSFDKIKSYSINSTWNSKKFLQQKLHMNANDTNTHIDTADSAGIKETNIKYQYNLTTTIKTLNEHDKIQLRDFIHHKLVQWKENHRNDKIISLADVMHDALAQDEPAYVYIFFSS
jgi:hypothetical protein